MGCCRGKKYNCGGDLISDKCVIYTGKIGDDSKLEVECDITVQEIIEDVIGKQEEILDSIDLSDFGKSCIKVSSSKKGLIKVREALLALEQYVCSISKEKTSSDIDLSKLDLKCLKTQCESEAVSLVKVLQLLVDEVCKLKEEVKRLSD